MYDLEEIAKQLSKETGATVAPHEYDVGYWAYYAGREHPPINSTLCRSGFRDSKADTKKLVAALSGRKQ